MKHTPSPPLSHPKHNMLTDSLLPQPTIATATPTAVPLNSTPPNFSCPSVNGTVVTDQNQIPYEVRCGWDITGVGIGGGVLVSNGFNDCFYQCDANSQCVAWVFSGGYCYLKVSYWPERIGKV